MTILDTIIVHKIKEVELAKKQISSLELEESIHFRRTCLSMKKALTSAGSSGIIAEFKRHSPSLGDIHPDPSLPEIMKGYLEGNAAALSVLTDQQFFKGNGEDLVNARELSPVPVLRKDFIVDEYQITEAKAMGADAILLIASILTPFEIERYASIAQVLGLEVLLEVHSLEELNRSLSRNIDMVGVNNRNLSDFSTRIEHSLELAQHIPDRYVKVAESGIQSPEDVKRLRDAGYQGFLIGGRFMSESDPGQACKAFIQAMQAGESRQTT